MKFGKHSQFDAGTGYVAVDIMQGMTAASLRPVAPDRIHGMRAIVYADRLWTLKI